MAYWERARKVKESIQVYEEAAEARYLEGLELIQRGYSGGGVYLLGYVAEILLKAAFFRIRGYAIDRTISAEDRSKEKTGVSKGHDVLEWAKGIVALRRNLDRDLKDRLMKHAVAQS